MAFTYILKPNAERQLEETCAESGDEVCERLFNWVERITELEENGHLSPFTMSLEEFLARLEAELEQDVSPLKEALSVVKKKSLLNMIRGALYFLRNWKSPWAIRVVRKDIRFFLKTLDIYAVYEVDRPNRQVVFYRFIGLPIDG